MMQFGLVGFGAGAAAALLFAASVTSGSWFSVLLFYMAPMPIMIAGLGWSHWVAVIAALTGAVALGLTFGTVVFYAFLGGAGIPACWLCYLTMLARPAADAGGIHQNGGLTTAAFEWYPPGRLVVWAAVLASLIVVVAIPNFGTDAESFRAGLHGAIGNLLQAVTDAAADKSLALPGVSNTDRLIDFFVTVIPPTAAVLATITSLLNLWLSARIVKFSGRLTRPWPQLSAMAFPRFVPAMLAVAFGLSFAGGLIGIVAGVLAASLLMAYGVLGFAVLHAITPGMDSRAFLIGGVYAAVLVFGWPILALCVLGLSESVFDLRARVARKRGLPAPS